MTFTDKYDKVIVGTASGFFLPVIVSLTIYAVSSGDKTLTEYFSRIISADILTHVISLCVLSNLILFLVFNRLDMLRATRGVLGITLFWALFVFAVKFLL
jgi:hypothetical protein